MKKILIGLGIIIVLILLVGGSLFMIYVRPFMQKMMLVQVVKYDSSLTLVLGGGGNTGIIRSDSLVIVIDTKMNEGAEGLFDTVKKIAGDRPILVINTHWHKDHTDGNSLFNGQSILAGANYDKGLWIKESGESTLPTRWLKDSMDVPMGDDTVTVLNLGRNGHTPSDIVVYLHRRKMLFGGDVILNKQAPGILGAADPDGYLWAFDMLTSRFDVQKVVPGHGQVGGIEVIDRFREYFLDMKLAASDESQKDKLVSKYDDWAQIPVFMSPGATVKAFRKKITK